MLLYMAIRFGLYQNSIKKFINNQSIISKYRYKQFILDLTENNDYILPISLLTVINGQQKKNNLKSVHGYEMATGIELLIIFLNIVETKKFNKILNGNYSHATLTRDQTNLILKSNISNHICQEITSMIYQTLNRNINDISTYYSSDAMIKIYLLASEHLHAKIDKINSTVSTMELPQDLEIQHKTFLENFHFVDSNNLNKLSCVKQLPKDFVLQYISGTYGSICKLALIFGWLIGGSVPDMIPNLEKIGYHFGIMIKLAYDFTNVERDVSVMNNGISFNYIINFGFQDAFELFDDCKRKFIEGVLTMNISTPTLKEFIDILERKVDCSLEQSSPDIKSSSSHPN